MAIADAECTVIPGVDSCPADGLSGVDIIVTLMDADGETPIVGATVALATDAEGVDIGEGTNEGVSDANGEVIFSIHSEYVHAAAVFTATVTSEEPDLVLTDTATIAFTDPLPEEHQVLYDTPIFGVEQTDYSVNRVTVQLIGEDGELLKKPTRVDVWTSESPDTADLHGEALASITASTGSVLSPSASPGFAACVTDQAGKLVIDVTADTDRSDRTLWISVAQKLYRCPCVLEYPTPEA